MIASSIPGRVRIRDQALRSDERACSSRALLLAVSGVTSVRVNVRLGSLLVIFDPTATSERALLEAVGLGAQPSTAAAPVGRRATIPSCMAASLAVTLGAAALGMKWLHVVAGTVFVACVGAHVLPVGKRDEGRRR